jgi:hypothetical protein
MSTAATSNLVAEQLAQVRSVSPVGSALGASMEALRNKHEAKAEMMRLSGSVKPATVVNLNPMELSVESPLVTYKVPAPKDGESYGYVTITDAKFAHPFRGVKKSADGMNEIADFDVIEILPVQQAMEFFRTYMETPQDMQGGSMGGVFIYEGDISVLENAKKDTTVQVPYTKLLKDGSLFVGTKPERLLDLRDRALDTVRNFALAKIQEAEGYADDPKQRANITVVHRRYARFAVDQGWRSELPKWVTDHTTVEDLCPKCRTKVHSDQYMCGNCNKVFDPVRAYEEGDIAYGHVSFEKLDAAGWKAVKKIHAAREKMKGDDKGDQ